MSIQLVSAKAVSAMLDVPEGTLRYWRHVGRGPDFVQAGGRIKYNLADLERWVKSNRCCLSAQEESDALQTR